MPTVDVGVWRRLRCQRRRCGRRRQRCCGWCRSMTSSDCLHRSCDDHTSNSSPAGAHMHAHTPACKHTHRSCRMEVVPMPGDVAAIMPPSCGDLRGGSCASMCTSAVTSPTAKLKSGMRASPPSRQRPSSLPPTHTAAPRRASSHTFLRSLEGGAERPLLCRAWILFPGHGDSGSWAGSRGVASERISTTRHLWHLRIGGGPQQFAVGKRRDICQQGPHSRTNAVDEPSRSRFCFCFCLSKQV